MGPMKIRAEWWSRSGSNRRPPECKSGALPTELRPRQVVGSNRPFDELMEVKNYVLQKLFCVILDGSSISLLLQAVIDLITKCNLAP